MSKIWAGLIAVFAAVAVAACGGSSSSSTTSAPASATTSSATTSSAATAGTSAALALAADPSGQLKFTKTTLSAKAGEVKIEFTNQAALPHNLTIAQGSGGEVAGATPTFQGGTKTLSVKLKPGTYTFYCSVPGHRQAGMQGTLTVQ
jgi:plastocyanin